jgi:hypothetical protein
VWCAGPATGARTGQISVGDRSDRSVLPGRLGDYFECQHYVHATGGHNAINDARATECSCDVGREGIGNA